jgi:hypothetical protein
VSLPERLSYRVKRVLLGPPLVTAQLHEEKLSKKTALGVLSSDCISSSAYGTEEMLIILLAVFGLTGFHILLPMTGVILVILTLMTLSYCVDLVHRGKYAVHRLPLPGELRRRGFVLATPADPPWASPGVQ